LENYSHITPRGSIASTSSSLPSTPLPTISSSPPLAAAAAAGYSVAAECVDMQSNGTLYHNLGKCGAQNSPPAYSAGHVGNIYDSVA